MKRSIKGVSPIVRIISPILLIIALNSGLTAQEVIFRSPKYTVTDAKVTQGNYQAVAKSPYMIESTYQSDYAVRTRCQIEIKFSINGFDNEAPAGQDHYLSITPTNGEFDSPTYMFGQFSTANDTSSGKHLDGYLGENSRVTIRVDMRAVLEALREKGYYVTPTGQKITAADFKGLYIAGNTPPLSWNFQELPNEPQFALEDPDSDGIYQVTVLFQKEQFPGRSKKNVNTWNLTRDISAYPQFHSPSVLAEALYNKSLEEMLEDIRPDGAFMAGAMWPGVWTRDISYSSLLSLAIINPDAVKASLMAKVKDDRIIQDTGTGGSWPISSDRMVWALAAWEVYKVTGDKDWLGAAYKIVSNSAADDLHTLVDPSTGLFHGESSFLDWREQTYPRWMDPKDIFESENLGTNAVHYQTYRILAEMAEALAKPSAIYSKTADRIKEGINKYLWIDHKGYYGQYIYGRDFKSLSPRSESLGEALCVLFGVADNHRGKEIIRQAPATQFGMTCIYPQIPNIPPYHNDAVWPFVESYWAWASAKACNVASVSQAIGSVYRAAALFLTNKENMVASTGDFMGTQINSSRQLWSVAGNLAIVYRVIFGMEFHQDSLTLKPCIPPEFDGVKTLTNFKYRKSILEIAVDGSGDAISYMTIDGKKTNGSSIPGSLVGKHTIMVKMNGRILRDNQVNLVADSFAPDTPVASFNGSTLTWDSVKGADEYVVFRNAKKIWKGKKQNLVISSKNDFGEYQVLVVDGDGNESFLSEPVVFGGTASSIMAQAEAATDSVQKKYAGYTGTGYVELRKDASDVLAYSIDIPETGTYAVDFRYANGNGPINTDNKCAIRTLKVDGRTIGSVVLPQRGEDNWRDWGYSNANQVRLSKGKHMFSLVFNEHDNNMNGAVNTALLDAVRVTMIGK